MTDLMKLDVMRPEKLVDINPLTNSRAGQIEVTDSGIRFGALVQMAQAEAHPAVRSSYPVIADR